MLATITLFLLSAAGTVLAWNRWFTPVRLRVAALLVLMPMAYMAPTMFSVRVDVPANLAFVAFPWQATNRPPVQANTGIILTQIAPWTAVARASLSAGEMPHWNRFSASGAPLLANQQTAIFHPFTLLGFLLPPGKAFTLTAALRLFAVAFFTYLLLRNFGLCDSAALVGSLAYGLCSFHIVWLLFPLGLSSMMLPMCLVGVQELARTRFAGFSTLVIALSLSVLGGHPESAVWVWIATALFASVSVLLSERFSKRAVTRLAFAASAFITAMLLTAWWWYPTLGALRHTSRFNAMQSVEANPADHGLSCEWLLALIAPNVLGNPANGTYVPPAGSHPAVLNDYGEVASGYAGLATLALALGAPFVSRRRAAVFFGITLMVLSIATFAEIPVWRDLLRSIPLVGISIHQRLRLFWNLGACIAAAATLDTLLTEGVKRRAVVAIAASMIAFGAIYTYRSPSSLHTTLGMAQCAVPLLAAAAISAAIVYGRYVAAITAAFVALDLVVATFGYNPSAIPTDLYVRTGAIATMQEGEDPFRIAAVGWSLLPDTPAYYGLEDVKTTDPVQHDHYMRLLRGFLRIDASSYDLEIKDVSQPFFDYLNIRYVYAPPGQAPPDPRLVKIYEGIDGTVLENSRVLPRYFLAQSIQVEPDFDRTVARSVGVRDFWRETLVDRIPDPVRVAAQGVLPERPAGGLVRLRSYGPNSTRLEVESSGWNLLVSSDVAWPGWHAYWNGERQETVCVNGAFVGCFVPPGRGTLELRYRPAEFDQGLRATAIGAIALLAVFFIRRRVTLENF